VGSEELDRGDHGTATLSLSNLRASLLKMPASYEINKELEMVHEKLSLMLNDPKLPRVQERCHPFHSYFRGLEDMTNASLQRGRQG
jgi:hypothetical protein